MTVKLKVDVYYVDCTSTLNVLNGGETTDVFIPLLCKYCSRKYSGFRSKIY